MIILLRYLTSFLCALAGASLAIIFFNRRENRIKHPAIMHKSIRRDNAFARLNRLMEYTQETMDELDDMLNEIVDVNTYEFRKITSNQPIDKKTLLVSRTHAIESYLHALREKTFLYDDSMFGPIELRWYGERYIKEFYWHHFQLDPDDSEKHQGRE